ncbi:hypothetical protein FQN57_001886 [Myotisia sp. PD_48]|nr:hypothetical protein FQN57_001886 [Myotisia sp. PD_48]
MSRLASSPHSSREAASRHGSPETRLTAFSPEDARFNSRGGSAFASATRSGDPMIYSLQSFGHGHDPFMSTPTSARRAQLSPTASSFTPVGWAKHVSTEGTHQPSITDLTATSEPDTQNIGGTFAHRSPVDFGPIGGARVVQSSFPIMYCQFGQFDSENRNRAFAIDGAPTDTPYQAVAAIFDRREFSTVKGPVFSELSSVGRIFVGFTDMRDAKCAYAKVRHLHPEWIFRPITAREFSHKFEPHLAASVSNFEGQIFVSVYYNGSHRHADGRVISHSFKDLLETFGDLRAFSSYPTAQDNVIDFIAEFFDTRVADNVVASLHGTLVDDCVLDIKYHKPDVNHHAHHAAEDKEARIFPEHLNYQPLVRRSDSMMSTAPYMELSPTGRSTIPIGDPSVMTWNRKSDEGQGFRPRHSIGRSSHDSRPMNQNYVDIDRIRLGLDVRTTIMLRNIPNKIDQAMLKDIVDETSHGKYDFMYLRIDFANNCNVGYAFINFEDPIDIIDFAKSRAGHSCDKVAEISYATIQGKDCLVQKFRNSSVMLEHPSFRPKIFHTGTGPLAGTEDRFPGPDNPSKMRRSVENAEHVGLFAPRVGQQYRDEQRRRRSQFDRGTTAAEHESYWIRNATPRRANMNDMPPPIMAPWYESPIGENSRSN